MSERPGRLEARGIEYSESEQILRKFLIDSILLFQKTHEDLVRKFPDLLSTNQE